ncbi:hypothetical protein D3A96_05380 [Robertkochia marina]|nr:hypothetical protein D3A96_05380 [Robertkochia marina]
MFFACCFTGHAQESKPPVKFGIETDVLPYALGGFMGAAWMGKGHFRIRSLYAYVKMPKLITPDQFTNHRIRSFALLVDYFPKKEFTGWWAGGGMAFWNGSIQTKDQPDQNSDTRFRTYLLNGSAGYIFSFGEHFYLGPWSGLSIRVGGNRNIAVDTETYDPPLLNPELSAKLGWIF